MKRLKYGLLAAAMVASVAVVPAVASAEEAATTTAATEEAAKVTKKAKVGGKWVKTNDNRWWYSYDDGTYASYEFVSGWWVNKAGYWGDADGDHSTYDWYTVGKTWHYGNRTWSCGSEYANDEEDGKAKWWKIDGQWYYFMADGSLVTSAVVGNYIVDKTGAWLEGYKGQWRHGATNKTDWWYAISDESGKLVDWFDWTDGIVQINGDKYIFDAEGWLFTDEIVPYQVDDEDYIFLAPDKDGHFGLYTSFRMFPYDDVDYTVEFNFENTKQAQNAAKSIKNFLLATVASNKATDAYQLGVYEVDGNYHDILAGKLMNWEPVDGVDGYFDDDDNWVDPVAPSIKWSQTATNVYVSLDGKQTAELFKDEDGDGKMDYDGTWGFDGTDPYIQQLIKDKDYAIPYLEGDVYIPLVNYVKLFATGTKATVKGSASLDDILDAYKYGAASLDFKATLSIGKAKVELGSFGVDGSNISMTVDGKKYEGVFAYTTDTMEVVDDETGKKKEVEYYDDLFFIFAGDHTKTLAVTLVDMDVLTGCWLVDSATQDVIYDTTEETVVPTTTYHYGWTYGPTRTEFKPDSPDADEDLE